MREKIIIIILFVLVLALGWELYADKSRRDSFEFTEKCSSQAAKVFARLGYSDNGPTNGVSATYQSRYNVGLNKCFMALETTAFGNKTETVDDFLFNSYEQREYAEYIGKAGDPLHSIMCQLLPLSGEKRSCASLDEYNAFVADYMK